MTSDPRRLERDLAGERDDVWHELRTDLLPGSYADAHLVTDTGRSFRHVPARGLRRGRVPAVDGDHRQPGIARSLAADLEPV